jgi:hypothetical protein
MPKANMFLIPLVLALALGFIWLSYGVLDARRQWDVKVKAKAADVAKVEKEIDVLINGAEDFGAEFFKNVVAPIKEPAPGLWSPAANAKYEEQVAAGVGPQLAFEAAMNLFVDKKLIDDFQKAVKELNDVQKAPIPDEIQLDAAVKAYDSAQRDMAAAMTRLDDAYQFILGQKGPGGIRNLAGKTMSIDAMRQSVVHFRAIIYAQRAQFSIMLSDGQKNETRMRDLWQETGFEAGTMQQASANGQRELEDRTKEVEELKLTKTKELMELANEEAKRDKAIADLADLDARYKKVKQTAIELAQVVKEKEIAIDKLLGSKTALYWPDAIAYQAQIGKIDDQDGTAEINVGTAVGARPGVRLHVYRWAPEAKYLGMMEIIKSESNKAVGRMLPEYRQITIQTGDKIGPEILPPPEGKRPKSN